MNDTGKIVLAAAAGIAVGALAGILLAPASGKETREKLMGKASDIKDKAEDAVKGAKESVKKAAQQAAESTNGQS
jgi:gas vesicle protein